MLSENMNLIITYTRRQGSLMKDQTNAGISAAKAFQLDTREEDMPMA